MGNRSLLVAVGLALALPASALTEPAGLAAPLRVSATEAPAFMLSGDGVYVYQCRASLTMANAYEWGFIVPDATLYEGSRSVARHSTVGIYEAISDRSSVSGIVRGTQPAGVTNLPWVLIRAQPLSDSGIFAGVTSIQRVNTRGGAAPTTGCGADTEGTESRVAYKADYYFYKRVGET